MNAGQQIRVPPPPGALFAHLLNPAIARRVKDFFAYTADFLPIANGATVQVTTAVQNDSDFLLFQANAAVDDTAGSAIDPAVTLATVQIRDAASSRNLQDNPMGFSTIFGTAQLPGFLAIPKFFRAGGTIATTLTNNHGANLNVRITYLGMKLFPEDYPTN